MNGVYADCASIVRACNTLDSCNNNEKVNAKAKSYVFVWNHAKKINASFCVDTELRWFFNGNIFPWSLAFAYAPRQIKHFFPFLLQISSFFVHLRWAERKLKEVHWFCSDFIVFARQNTSLRRNTLLTYSAVCAERKICSCFKLMISVRFFLFFVSLSFSVHSLYLGI